MILLLTDAYPPHPGGIATLMQGYVHHWNQQGIPVCILTMHTDTLSLSYEQIGDNYIYKIGGSRLSYQVRSLFLLYHIYTLYPEIDQIYCSSYGSMMAGYIYGVWLGHPVTCIVHEIYHKQWHDFAPGMKAYIYRLYEYICFACPLSHYECVSQYTADRLVHIYPTFSSRIVVIRDRVLGVLGYINPPQSLLCQGGGGTVKEALRLLYIGHAGISKGLEYLIHALPQILAQTSHHIHLHISPSHRQKKMITFCNHLIGPDHPRCTITTAYMTDDERDALITSCDAVICPSLSEGLGLIQLEAQHAGKIIIATRVGAVPECLHTGVIWIQPGSSEAIVEATLTL